MSFLDPANWQQIYSQALTGAPAPGGAYVPIPPVTVADIDQDYIAVSIAAPEAPPNWKTGAWLSQLAAVPGVGDVILTRRRVPLGQVALLNLVNVTPYFVQIVPPYWIQSLTLTVWKYTGPRPIEQ